MRAEGERRRVNEVNYETETKRSGARDPKVRLSVSAEWQVSELVKQVGMQRGCNFPARV